VTLAQLEANLGDLLINAGGSRELVVAVQKTSAEVLRDFREDAQRHGGSGNEPFFDLVAFDSNPVDPCPFVFIIFRNDEVTVHVGNGLLRPLIDICDRLKSSQVDELESELVRLWPQPASMTCSRSVIEHWLAG
jgi:hypothetical protein